MDKLFVLALFICLAACQSTDDCPAALPRDANLRAFGDSCYQFVLARQRTHSQAKQDCETNRGHLVSIKSQAVQDFLFQALTNDYHDATNRYWIGLNDIDKEDEFKWEDGTPLAYSNWDANNGPNITTLTHGWSKDENDCVVLDLHKSGKWVESPCEQTGFLIVFSHDATHPYICQYAISGDITTSADVSGMTGTTNVVQTNPCPAFSCDLDCGANGFKKDGTSDCFICQCNT